MKNFHFAATDEFMPADRQCVIKVGISPGPPVRTSWYQIWQQAVALGVLCGESGKNGEAFIYGVYSSTL